jgi:hypothetical protein
MYKKNTFCGKFLTAIGLFFVVSTATESKTSNHVFSQNLSLAKDNTEVYVSQRPPVNERLFRLEAVEKKIREICNLLKNAKLSWMFANCFPNTIDTTVHFDYFLDRQKKIGTLKQY